MTSGYGNIRQRDGRDVFIAPAVGRVPVPFVFPPQSEPEGRTQPADFAGGVRLDVSATVMPPNSASRMVGLRFEENGIRKEFGFRRVGDPAPSKILGIGDHKLVESTGVFHRLVRITRNAEGKADLWVWTGSTWTLVDTSDEVIADTFLKIVSTQNRLLIADGTQILSWDEDPEVVPQEADFPTGNLIEEIGQSVAATITPAPAIFNEFEINYSVEVDGASTTPRILTLAFLHEDEVITTRVYNAGNSGLFTRDHETIVIQAPVQDTEEIRIRAEDFEVSGALREASFVTVGGTPTFVAEKEFAPEAVGKKYTYKYSVTVFPPLFGPESRVTVGIYRDSGSGHTKIDEKFFTNNTGANQTFNVTDHYSIDNMGNGDEFGLHIESIVDEGGTINPDRVEWQEGDITFEVKGFNETDDSDPAPGVTWNTEGSPISTFEELDDDAPAASYIIPYQDRLIALRDSDDPQRISWPVRGDLEDWTGVGSGAVSVLDARMDPLDELQSGGVVADNVLAIIRTRSILRMVPTGQALLAFAIAPWIEGIGTESPHSTAQVRDGIMFLGHDMIVYYFTGSAAPIPVGKPIQRYIVENVSQDLDRVDAAYDPVFSEYLMSLPNGTVWIFDLGEYIETQNIRWRSRELQVERIASVSRTL